MNKAFGELTGLLNKWGWLWVLILSIPTVWALKVPGFFGASDDLHVGWLFEMDRIIRLGQFPPRFVPDLSFGFGYPLFNFVFPLPFYIGELFHLLSFSLVDSVKIVFALGLSISALTMYFFLREFCRSSLAILGSVIYLYAPYRANDVYNRGDIGEALSFIFLPLIGLAIIKLSGRIKFDWRWIGIGALSLSLLVLSHDITAYMFFPAAALLGLIFLILQKQLIPFLNLLLMVAGGLLVSIYFWLPALRDSHLMKYDTVFNFIDHFPTLRQLFSPYWGYGASVAGPYDGMSFFIGSANLIALFGGIILMVIFWKKYNLKQQVLIVWSTVIFLISMFLMDFRSVFLWSHLPFLPLFQFPWRFLILTTFVTPIYILTLEKVNLRIGIDKIAFILTAIIVIFSTFMFRPHDFLGRTDAYYINRYIPYPVASKEYLNIAEEYLRLPKTALRRPDKIYPPVFGNAKILASQNNALDIQAKVATSAATTVNFNKYYFPGWIGELDGGIIILESGEPFGQISTQVPAGNHTLEVKFTETTANKILDLISLLAVLAAVVLVVI